MLGNFADKIVEYPSKLSNIRKVRQPPLVNLPEFHPNLESFMSYCIEWFTIVSFTETNLYADYEIT